MSIAQLPMMSPPAKEDMHVHLHFIDTARELDITVTVARSQVNTWGDAASREYIAKNFLECTAKLDWHPPISVIVSCLSQRFAQAWQPHHMTCWIQQRTVTAYIHMDLPESIRKLEVKKDNEFASHLLQAIMSGRREVRAREGASKEQLHAIVEELEAQKKELAAQKKEAAAQAAVQEAALAKLAKLQEADAARAKLLEADLIKLKAVQAEKGVALEANLASLREDVQIMLSNDEMSFNQIKHGSLLENAQKTLAKALFNPKTDSFKTFMEEIEKISDHDINVRLRKLKLLLQNYTGSDKAKFTKLLDNSQASRDALNMLATILHLIWSSGNWAAHQLYDRESYMLALNPHAQERIPTSQKSGLTVLLNIIHPV